MVNLTRNMHYDYKSKLNKLDSQKQRNMRVPEIDWKLNEAQELLIRMIAFPRLFRGMGFEINQRSIDDLRTIVVDRFPLSASPIGNDRVIYQLPENYLHYLSSRIICAKGDCRKIIRATVVQHDDRFEEDPFSKSSFEWEEINILFTSVDGVSSVNAFTDQTFTAGDMLLDYLRKPKYIHSAVDSVGGTYTLPDSTVLTGYQNCELPEILHREIVDLAVFLTTTDLLADYQVKQAKFSLNS